MGFGRVGPSLGYAISLGAEATIQNGSLSDFEGTADLNANPVELEVGTAVGANVVLDATSNGSKPIGIGLNVGAGGGATFNLTKNTATTGAFNLYKVIKGLLDVAKGAPESPIK